MARAQLVPGQTAIMVRGPCIDKNTGVKKGAWSEEEDNKLRAYVQRYGHWNWRQLPKFADLNRCGKSCRLRWMNYLKPGVRRGNYTPQEEGLIRELHAQFGNKWSVIATKLPGRTDNDIKNHWHSHLVGMKVKADHSKSKDPEETKFEMNEEESSTLDEEPSSSSVSTSRLGVSYDSGPKPLPPILTNQTVVDDDLHRVSRPSVVR